MAYQYCFDKPNNSKNRGQKSLHSCSRPQLIHRISIEKKYDFYGYHGQKQLFLKIELFDEYKKKKIAKLLELGIVGFTCFQPYEVHINVFNHFYYECDLHGFADLNSDSYTTRYPNGFLPKNFYKKTVIPRLFKQGIYMKKQYFQSNEYPRDTFGRVNDNYKLGCKGRIEKATFAELEADVHYTELNNYIEVQKTRRNSADRPKISSRNSEMYFQSCQNNQPPEKNNEKFENIIPKQVQLRTKWSLKITKILEHLWNDEKNRRVGHGLDDNMDWFIDLSSNLDRKLNQKGQMLDLLEFTNHIAKNGNLNKLTSIILDFKTQKLRSVQPNRFFSFNGEIQIQVDRKKCWTYWKELQQEDKNSIISLKNRYHQYYLRKKQNKLNEIAIVDVDIEDDALEGYNEEISEIEKCNKSFFGGIYAHNIQKAKQKKLNIMNFFSKQEKNSSNSNKGQVDSNCIIEDDLTSLPNDTTIKSPRNNHQEKNSSGFSHFRELDKLKKEASQGKFATQKLIFKTKPPSPEKVVDDIKNQQNWITHQYPFFSRFEDLLSHYKKNLPASRNLNLDSYRKNQHNQRIFVYKNLDLKYGLDGKKYLGWIPGESLPFRTKFLDLLDEEKDSARKNRAEGKKEKLIQQMSKLQKVLARKKLKANKNRNTNSNHNFDSNLKTIVSHNSPNDEQLSSTAAKIDNFRNFTLKFNFKAPPPSKVSHDIIENQPELQKLFEKKEKQFQDQSSHTLGGGLTFKTSYKTKRLSISKFKTRDTSAHQQKLKKLVMNYENGNNDQKGGELKKKTEDDVYMNPEIENLVSLGIESISGNIDLGHWVSKAKMKRKKPKNSQNYLNEKSEDKILITKNPKLKSNPENDSILAILYTISSEKLKIIIQNEGDSVGYFTGLLFWCKEGEFDFYQQNKHRLPTVLKFDDIDEITILKNELSLIIFFMHLIQKLDPDILSMYDAERGPLMHLVHRASRYGFHFLDYIGRMPSSGKVHKFYTNFCLPEQDVVNYIQNPELNFSADLIQNLNGISRDCKRIQNRKGANKKLKSLNYNLSCNGRNIINVWRIARHDLKLRSYDLPNVYEHIFGKRTCTFSDYKLNKMFTSPNLRERGLVFQYMKDRATKTHQILTKLSYIPKTIEQSKVYCIAFESVNSRGAQFMIEAALSRVSKAHDYLLLSATKKQVTEQPILKCYALNIEPSKQFFSDPVAVVDFQSLYPSIMISHNYCFSTCLGDVTEISKHKLKRIGVTDTDLDLNILDFELKDYASQLEKDVFIAPNKVAYVRNHVRRGIVPQILEEFLQTRIMMKQSKKFYKKYEHIQNIIEGRQMAIKLFMNVMYGYTAASVHGRMPCCDIADSTVETGKFIMQRCKKFVENHKKYRGEVIYGDTDSLFILFRGQSVEIAMK